MQTCARTDIGEEYGQEYEAVKCSEHHDSHVHAEVEHLEELWVRERKHKNAAELRQSDPAQHLHDRIRLRNTEKSRHTHGTVAATKAGNSYIIEWWRQ